MDRKIFTQLIRNYEFRELFIDLGWDDTKLQLPISIDDHIYLLNAVAQKRGFAIFTCSPKSNGTIPDSNTRRKIDRQITKRFFEHIIIFTDSDKSQQIWHSNVRKSNKPIKPHETVYYTHQDPELLFQKISGLAFTLDEEDQIGLVDVRERVSEHFNRNTERVTKKFYEKFKKRHSAFLSFIEGIQEKVDKEWYASLMLNRLMFIYFIQKKGFLDNDKNYLRNRLNQTQDKKGKDQFYSFYRDFLLVLFHKGLGSPHHDSKLVEEIGKVPYLNGGLFDVHRLEKDNPDLNIRDEAFEQIFEFFDDFRWHLDTHVTSSGNDINPDVIGYIFEKYINDRAEMGAYYTKEDITDYISKNSIIPRLFDMVKKDCSVAFTGESSLWKLLQDNPDRYIYEAVQHGSRVGLSDDFLHLSIDERVSAGLPDNIAVGIDTEGPDLLERRKYWNKRAPEEIALPTEIYREVVERRQRYWDIYDKLSNGEITSINDFITYNLNIVQFAQDALEFYEGSDFIKAMYDALCRITVLDPTCGSGAFLFAAMNILESLYETCLRRMKEFVELDDKANGRRYPQFREVLREKTRHPNSQYYIYKKIILQNLYGVDIMNEAVEIAKLRLFLKLMAELDSIDQVEPLPDIDFNIRAGNTLVGFATKKELHDAISTTLDFDDMESIIHETMEQVALAFKRYKEVQLSGEELESHAEYKAAKDELNRRLDQLNEKLNHYLAQQYGVNPAKTKDYERWKASHKPFHWLAEFYEIIHANGGFDVIIGNPPYVEYSTVKKKYQILNRDYMTLSCGNLFALAVERTATLIKNVGKSGLILPISLICTKRMEPLVRILTDEKGLKWTSCYAERPSKLFSGAEILIAISLIDFSKNITCNFVTGLRKWNSDYRPALFPTTIYNQINYQIRNYLLPKINSDLEIGIIKKIFNQTITLDHFLLDKSEYKIFYRIGGGRYWKIFTNFQPQFILNGINSTSSRENYLFFRNSYSRDIAISVLSSNLFFWYFQLTTNGRDLNPFDLRQFPINIEEIPPETKNRILKITNALMLDYHKNKSLKSKVSKKTGYIKYEEFYPRHSKAIIDNIDKLLASLYKFSDEELDYIINYDIKYRMGEDLEKKFEGEEL